MLEKKLDKLQVTKLEQFIDDWLLKDEDSCERLSDYIQSCIASEYDTKQLKKFILLKVSEYLDIFGL